MHLGRGLAALAGVRLVDQQRELAVAQVAQLVEDEGEFLHRGDNDFLAPAQEVAQFLRIVRMAEDRGHMVVALDGLAQSGDVERSPVGDDDDRIELRLRVSSAAVFNSTNWYASHAMVLLLPLPAECWIR